jgi:hypothetical protein
MVEGIRQEEVEAYENDIISLLKYAMCSMKSVDTEDPLRHPRIISPSPAPLLLTPPPRRHLLCISSPQSLLFKWLPLHSTPIASSVCRRASMTESRSPFPQSPTSGPTMKSWPMTTSPLPLKPQLTNRPSLLPPTARLPYAESSHPVLPRRPRPPLRLPPPQVPRH